MPKLEGAIEFCDKVGEGSLRRQEKDGDRTRRDKCFLAWLEGLPFQVATVGGNNRYLNGFVLLAGQTRVLERSKKQRRESNEWERKAMTMT